MEAFRKLFGGVNGLSPKEMDRVREIEGKVGELRELPPEERGKKPKSGLVRQRIKEFEGERESPFLGRALKQSTSINTLGRWFGLIPEKDKDGNPI